MKKTILYIKTYNMKKTIRLTESDLTKIVKRVILEQQLKLNLEPRITTSYRMSDEESAEMGEYKEQGWEDEEGVSMTPDEYDLEEGITAVDKAVEFLTKKGAFEPSSSHFSTNLWYSSVDSDIDYTTGEDIHYDYHLEGFTEEEKLKIFNKIKRIRISNSFR